MIIILILIVVLYILAQRWEEFEDYWTQYKYRKIYLYVRYDIRHGIKSYLRWYKTIWNDRNWDFQYTYEILREKIKFQKEYFQKSQLVLGWEDQVKQLAFCERILNRLIEDDYTTQAYTEQLETRIVETVKETTILNGEEKTVWRLVDNRPKEIQEKEDKIMRDSWAWEEHWKERDKKLLYKMLEKYSEEWWD